MDYTFKGLQHIISKMNFCAYKASTCIYLHIDKVIVEISTVLTTNMLVSQKMVTHGNISTIVLLPF